jgi:hypothetical protein
MSADGEREHLLGKIHDHLGNLAQDRADILRSVNKLIEALDLEGKHLTPEQREVADRYLRMIRGEDR